MTKNNRTLPELTYALHVGLIVSQLGGFSLADNTDKCKKLPFYNNV